MSYAVSFMYIPEMFYQRCCRKDSITGSSFNMRKAEDLLHLMKECEIYNLYMDNPELSIKILCACAHLYGKKLEELNGIKELIYFKKLPLDKKDYMEINLKWFHYMKVYK